MNATELKVNRRTTLEFIKADKVSIVLTPNTFDKTGTGGKKWIKGDPRTIQDFRLIPQSDVQTSVQTPDGIQLIPTYVLMGVYDAAIGRWDTFSLSGVEYQVVSTVRPEHTVESRYFSKVDVARR